MCIRDRIIRVDPYAGVVPDAHHREALIELTAQVQFPVQQRDAAPRFCRFAGLPGAIVCAQQISAVIVLVIETRAA